MMTKTIWMRKLANVNSRNRRNRHVKSILMWKNKILNHVINAEDGDRPKDTRSKKTQTKTQFKREFLKSEDAAEGDNLDSFRPRHGLSLPLWTFVSLTFMNYVQLFLSPANSNGSCGRSSFSTMTSTKTFVSECILSSRRKLISQQRYLKLVPV